MSDLRSRVAEREAEVRLLRRFAGDLAMHRWRIELPSGRLWLSAGVRHALELAPHDELTLMDLSRFTVVPGTPHLKAMLEAITAGEPFELHAAVRTATGTLRVVTTSGVPSRDESGAVCGYECQLIDDAAQEHALAHQATERAKAERSLSALQVVIDGTEHSVIATDPIGIITVFNRGAERLLGYSADEVLGRHTPALVHDETEVREHAEALSAELGTAIRPGFEAFVARARRGGSETREWTYLRKDGTRLPVSLTVTALRNPHGEVTGFLGLAIDITEKKRAEAERSEFAERLLKLSRHLPGAVYQFQTFPDGRSCFPWSSEGLRHIYGLSPDDVRADASKAFATLHPDDLAHTSASIAQSAEALTTWRHEYRVIVDGAERWLLGNATPERQSDGSTLWHGYVSDITDRKRFEAELVRAREQAVAASRVKSEFLANMSHEIRTPLNGVLGITELLRDTEAQGERKRLLDGIHFSGQTLLTLINDILDLSKVEAGRFEFERSSFSLRECLRRAVETVALRAESKGLPLRAEVADDVPTFVFGDPTRVLQVLVNLIGNAVKFTERGEVAVRLSAVGPTVRVEVRDTGIGIAPEKLGRLFEPFVQGDGSIARRYGGSGLGLAISRHLAQQMGGRLEAHSELGVGSRFIVDLPLPTAPAPASVVRAALAAPTRPLDVLVAEDNAINALVIRKLLERDGHRVTVVADGRAAIEATARHAYDLVLMDLQMPEVDGLEATRAIRAREASGSSHLTIWALTANAMQGDVERCLHAGMDDSLTKPIAVDVLRAKLASLASAPVLARVG